MQAPPNAVSFGLVMGRRSTLGAGASGASGTLGVVLVESPTVVRAGLRLLISSDPRFEVVAEAGTAAECLAEVRLLRRLSNLVAVVGLGLPGAQDAFWLIRSLRDQFPPIPVLACGAHADDVTISRALFVGADGFVDKDGDPREFLAAILATADGEVVLSGVPADWLGRIADGFEGQTHRGPLLTDRELEVLTVASQGLTARQIGRRLGVRERTVTTHLGRIYRKLGAGGRLAALRAAEVHGLVSRRPNH